MSLLNTLVFVIASVTLFLFGLQSFSREVQALSGGPLNDLLRRATRNRFLAAFTGAVTTALLQSSSAVSSLAVSLTNAGLLNLKAVMAVLIGANVGTASTAFIVSFKIHGLGAYLLVLGSLLSMLPIRISVMGKSIFYFGFILFALDQIGETLKPFFSEPIVSEILAHADNPLLGVGAGILLTALLQSSSVLTGLVVILAGQGLLTLPGAVAVVLGSNVGTTSTALVASLSMGPVARTAAVANLIYNLVGVILAFYFISLLAAVSWELGEGSLGLAVAFSHLLFNLGVGVFFLLFLTPTHDWLQRMLVRRGAL